MACINKKLLAKSQGSRHRAETYTPEITDANLQGHARTAFVAAGQVVRQPGDDARERRVNRTCGDENTAVHDLGVARGKAPASGQPSTLLAICQCFDTQRILELTL